MLPASKIPDAMAAAAACWLNAYVVGRIADPYCVVATNSGHMTVMKMADTDHTE
jgi:hypothetical protein